MRTKLTSEQHRFEAGRLMDDSNEWKFVYERTGDFACLAWARAKWLQARWHHRRWYQLIDAPYKLFRERMADDSGFQLSWTERNGGKP